MQDEDDSSLDVIRTRELQVRGDSFDIGDKSEGPMQEQDIIVRIMQNPSQLQDLLNVSDEQAGNISSAITGIGAGLAAKYLGKHCGGAVAGGFGGFLAGMIAEKIIGKDK